MWREGIPRTEQETINTAESTSSSVLILKGGAGQITNSETYTVSAANCPTTGARLCGDAQLFIYLAKAQKLQNLGLY